MPKVVNEIGCVQVKIDNWNSVGECVGKRQLEYGFDGVKDTDEANARRRFAEIALYVRRSKCRGRTSLLTVIF